MIFKKNIKKIATDLFISRLRCSVIGEGMLHEGNIFLIDYAIQNMPNNGITFEIGVYGGLSTNLILHLLKKHHKSNQLFGCDSWIYEGYNDNLENKETHIDGKKEIDRTDYMNYIKNSFIQATTLLHSNSLPFTCHLKSDDFFKNWNKKNEFQDVFKRTFSINESISFAYIDGDHSYEQTKKDFENVDSKLLKDGFVLIDDSSKNLQFGSAKYITKILKNPKYKLVLANPNYLFKKII